jgi:hypothetical protein
MSCCRVNFTKQQWMVTATFVVVNFCNAMCVSMQVGTLFAEPRDIIWNFWLFDGISK